MEINKRVHEIIDGGCWHKWYRESEHVPNAYSVLYCSKCPMVGFRDYKGGPINRDNPTYAHVDEIVEKMREKGIWGRFLEWHELEVYSPECLLMDNSILSWDDTQPAVEREAYIDILTTPDLLKQAIISWAEEGK